jgi:hypothetical protein
MDPANKVKEWTPDKNKWKTVVTAENAHFSPRDNEPGDILSGLWEPQLPKFVNPDNYRLMKFKDRLLIPLWKHGFYILELEHTKNRVEFEFDVEKLNGSERVRNTHLTEARRL